MAKQDGFYPLIGTLGITTFYKTPDGYFAKRKSGINRQRVLTDPNFERFRNNMAEFGRAGKAGKLLRTQTKSLLFNNCDRILIRRLTRELMRVIKSDPLSRPGDRSLQQGDLSLLKGFEFNPDCLFSVVFSAPYAVAVDSIAGTVSLDFPAFVPGENIKSPPGTTHFELTTAASILDFEKGEGITRINKTDMTAIGIGETTSFHLQFALPPGIDHPLFVFCGVNFYEEVNGEMNLISSAESRPLQIVEVFN